MKTKLNWIAAAVAALALSGCIDTSTKVTVKTDGTGTIEKTIIVSKALVDFMEGMGATGDAKTIQQSMVSESSLKAGAAKMGSDVTFVSAQKVTTAKGDGYKATYSFKDITKVKLDQNPAGDVTVPSAGGPSGGAQASTPELVTFLFTKGSPATLTIVSPKVQPAAANAKSAQVQTSAEDAKQAEQMMQALKPLYADLRIAVSVEVVGKITDTNAAYVDGSVVTLMDMDFGKILADDKVFQKLAAAQAQSVTEVQGLVKSIPGVKLDTQESIKISFR